MSSDEEFVKVLENESCEVVELPVESDGMLLLTTLQGQYPNAAGLRYRSSSGGWRGVRITGDVLNPPPGGWGCDTIYQITIKKDDETNTKAKDGIAEATQLQINEQLLRFSQLIQDKNSSDDIVEETQEKMINQFKDFAKLLAKGAGEISSSIEAVQVDPPDETDKANLPPSHTPTTTTNNTQGPQEFIRKTICRFFKIGACKKGSTCMFRHPGINDIGTKRKTQHLPKEKEEIPPKTSKHTNEGSKIFTHSLVVLDLPPECTSEDLNKYFITTCGELEHCIAHENKNLVFSKRGLAFIKFKTAEGEAAALTQQHRINGTLVRVQLKNVKETKLYVTGIHKETSDEDLKNYFETFAEVTEIYIPRPIIGVGYGFVTVKFSSQHDCMSALERTHTMTLRTPYKICDVTLCVTKADDSKRRKKEKNRKGAGQFNIHDGDYGNDEYEMDSRDSKDISGNYGSGKYVRNMDNMEEYTSDMGGYRRYGDHNSSEGNYGTDIVHGIALPLKIEDMSDILDYGDDRTYNDHNSLGRSNSGNEAVLGIASQFKHIEDMNDTRDYKDNRSYNDHNSPGRSNYGNEAALGIASQFKRIEDNMNDTRDYKDNRSYNDHNSPGRSDYGNEAALGIASQFKRIEDNMNDTRDYKDNRRYNDHNSPGRSNYGNEAALGIASQFKRIQDDDSDIKDNSTDANRLNDIIAQDTVSQLKSMIYSMLSDSK